jgi:hypothetical protein
MSFYDILRQPSQAWENLYCNSIVGTVPDPAATPVGVTGAIAGATAVPIVFPYSYYFLDSKTVCIFFDSAVGTCTINTNVLTLSLLPAAIRPARTLHVSITATNGLVGTGYIQIQSNGQATVTSVQGNFTTPNVVGLPGQSFIYSLA